MTFNKRSLIGGDLTGMSDLSAFGRLYRISRLNSLNARQAIDVMRINRSVRRYLERHAAFPWPNGAAWDQLPVPRSVRLAAANELIPYLLDSALQINEQIRGCRSCLRAGFHALLHQLPWIDLCPWHREPLVERCECGRKLLDGIRDTSKFVLVCPCGHDFYDRMDALASIGSWPSARAKRFVAKQVKFAEVSRATHRLKSDLDLSLDQAVAAALGKFIPAQHMIMTDVVVDQVSDDRKAQHRVITDWRPLDYFPSYPREYQIHLLRSESSHLKGYLHDLRLRTARSAAEHSWRAFHDQGNQLAFYGATVESIEGIDHTWISQRDHDVARKVVECFIQRHSAGQFDTHVSRNDQLQSVLGDPNIDLRGLAGTLSAISMQAFMEQSLHAVWSAYAWERLPRNLHEHHPGAVSFTPGSRFGHPIVVLGLGEPFASRVIRVISAPDFIDPPENLSGDYAKPTQRQRRDRSALYWT